MVGYLSKKPKLSFVDNLGKLYRQRRHATRDKGLETLDPKAKVEGPSESRRESPHPSPKEDQPQLPPMGEQPQPERKIELCTLDIVDLPIINLQDAGRLFEIKVSTIRITIARALERFNEYIRAEFLEWHISLLKRRMEKMEKKEA
jgi:DNA-directed RNA polymerase specialized sigma24 family protein